MSNNNNPFETSTGFVNGNTNPFITGESNSPTLTNPQALTAHSVGNLFSAESVIDNAHHRYVSQNALGSGRNRPLHSTAYPEQPEYERLKNANSVDSTARVESDHWDHNAPEATDTSTQRLLHKLIEGITNVTMQQNRPEMQRSSGRNNRVDLKLPRFDGTGDISLFIKQFSDVSMLSQWDPQVEVVQLRSCLEKVAKECGAADSVMEINGKLLARFGLSSSEAREMLHRIQRTTGESYLSLGSRVERLTQLAYGGMDKDFLSTTAMEHFSRAIEDPALRQHLLLVRARTLDATVTAAEQYILVGRQAGRLSKHKEYHRVAGVDNSDSEVMTANVELESLDSMELLQSISKRMDAQEAILEKQAERISQLESFRRPRFNAKRDDGVKRCYQCGDPSHLRYECPSRVRKNQPDMTAMSENQ